jgi:hypothetical protein
MMGRRSRPPVDAGLRGDVTGLRGDVSECGLTNADRAAGVNIADLEDSGAA